jgi:hypothetical protein
MSLQSPIFNQQKNKWLKSANADCACLSHDGLAQGRHGLKIAYSPDKHWLI